MYDRISGKYENHCWLCRGHISSETHERCEECGWYICACGACSDDCSAGAERLRLRREAEQERLENELRRQAIINGFIEFRKKQRLRREEQKRMDYYSLGSRVLFEGNEYTITSYQMNGSTKTIVLEPEEGGKARQFSLQLAFDRKSLKKVS